MGIDAKLTLPPGTRVCDLADATGALLGCKIDSEARYCPDVIGPEFTSEAFAGSVLSKIRIPSDVIPWEWGTHLLVHHEWGSDSRHRPFGPGSIGIMSDAMPFNVVLLRRLADIFGGSVDHDDCDENDEDYRVEPPEVMRAWLNDPYTNELWRAMKNAISIDIVPIT